MLLKITSVVKDAEKLDRAIVATVDQKVTGMFHNTERGPGAIAAETQVIDPNAFRQLRTLLGAGAFGVIGDVAQGLGEQGVVAEGGIFAEFLQTPVHYRDHVAPR
ncbi:hypothetical protein SBA4_5690008 [Candidatus Sulfopaludibacter sp. SbA4]|nr:hypothetical protein SBA4_5690008 [Candidatus Sulfopaludibacter sp. SbA4]